MNDIAKTLFTHLSIIDLINTTIKIDDNKYNKTIENYDERIKKFETYLNEMNIIGNFMFNLINLENEQEYVSEVMIVIFTTVYDKVLNRLNNAKRKRGYLKCLQK